MSLEFLQFRRQTYSNNIGGLDKAFTDLPDINPDQLLKNIPDEENKQIARVLADPVIVSQFTTNTRRILFAVLASEYRFVNTGDVQTIVFGNTTHDNFKMIVYRARADLAKINIPYGLYHVFGSDILSKEQQSVSPDVKNNVFDGKLIVSHYVPGMVPIPINDLLGKDKTRTDIEVEYVKAMTTLKLTHRTDFSLIYALEPSSRLLLYFLFRQGTSDIDYLKAMREFFSFIGEYYNEEDIESNKNWFKEMLHRLNTQMSSANVSLQVRKKGLPFLTIEKI